MTQMECTVTKAELTALQCVVEDASVHLRSLAGTAGISSERIAAERDRLRAARRAVHKVNKLHKLGALFNPQHAGGAGA